MSHPERKAIIYTSPKRSMYVGRLGSIVNRTNVASTLLVSVDQQMDLLNNKNTRVVRSKSFLVPAGMNISIDTHGAKVAQCFLDDIGTDLAKLIPQMKTTLNVNSGGRLYTDIYQESEINSYAGYLLNERPSNEIAQAQLETWFNGFSTSSANFHDERVEKVISLIKENCTDNISVSEIADSVCLSVPRLTQLFKKMTGVPIRRFRLWHRIFATATKLTQGFSLTDAAIAAGFCDYAQFSRVFKEMSGASPSVVKKNTEIRSLA